MDATRCLDDFDPDFKYTNENVSHSWLLNYPTQLKPDPAILKISSKNETFTAPEILHQYTTGKRKKLMEAFYRKIISEDVFGSVNESENIIVEDYETDYMEHFKNPDDLPMPGECLSKNEKLKLENKSNANDNSKKENVEDLKSKYPLYSSAPLTFVSQITGKENFRKKMTITKPPEENYDNIEY